MFSSYDIVCKSQGFCFKFSLSTNGQVLTSGSLDWTVQVWDVASSDPKFTSYVQANCMGIPMLIDAEKKREGLDDLLNLTDYVVCSAKFPQSGKRLIYIHLYIHLYAQPLLTLSPPISYQSPIQAQFAQFTSC
ncbi:hypothetical protein POM88_028615 [Heracleum sosnowskyi]|uniref:Uncharacterized protein n=1 Tax=Heracleum sosnowskyi TaxID=360622 RepID=A0AAD8MGW4_9APIA|nr:hypothetical protein POM88_028615 [Heracleum sosnowskyi]